MAKLYFNYGTMNAGKSIELIKVAFNYEETGHHILVMKPGIDTRGEAGYISCRMPGLERKAILFSEEENLFQKIVRLVEESEKEGKRISAILVDEAQFMNRQQVYQLSHVPDFLNISVLCYGLRTDAFGKAFGGSVALFELADVMNELITMSYHTDSKATMVYRMDENGNAIRHGETISIGGNEKYKPCSRIQFKSVMKDDTLESVMNFER